MDKQYLDHIPLCRGKRLNDETWVTGHAFYDSIFDVILMKINYLENESIHKSHEVTIIPSTLERFTGMNDVNDERMFEGNIVRVPETEFNAEIDGVIIFEEGKFIIESLDSGNKRDLDYLKTTFIIGDVNDNPQLRYPFKSKWVQDRDLFTNDIIEKVKEAESDNRKVLKDLTRHKYEGNIPRP